MDLTTMRTAVRTRIGVPSTDTFFVDATLTDIINEALAAVATERDWPWLTTSTTFPTVAGTATYTPTSGWTKTRSLTIDGFDSMEERSLIEIRSIPTTQRGQPSIFAVSGDQIILRTVPDAVYTITHDYVKTEPALSANGDTPLMPTQFHYAVVAKASELAHLRQGSLAKAEAQKAEYAAWLVRLNDNLRRTTAPKRIRVRPGSGL